MRVRWKKRNGLQSQNKEGDYMTSLRIGERKLIASFFLSFGEEKKGIFYYRGNNIYSVVNEKVIIHDIIASNDRNGCVKYFMNGLIISHPRSALQ